MRIGVIGINHKLADLKLRESFARIYQQRFSSGTSAHLDHTLVLLTTCNRSEVYFTSEDLTHTHSYIINILRRDLNDAEETFDQKLYSYFGHDCFKHLARVTAGLDSAIVAETEIQGQVRGAYETAAEYLNLSPELHFLFQKSLKIGKQIRSQLSLGRGIPSLEHAVLNASQSILENPQKSRILLVGASEINRKILSFLKRKQFEAITICNRSDEPAKALAEKYQLKILPWSHLSSWPEYDFIILGTKASHPILRYENRNHSSTAKLIIDLSVPRNADPRLARESSITLLNIDQLNKTLKNRRTKLHRLLLEAETMVHQTTRHQIELFTIKKDSKSRYLAAS